VFIVLFFVFKFGETTFAVEEAHCVFFYD
jgi:hypothetical protein